jgi:hypothetical protein
VIRSFGGQMHCESVEGEWTRFSLEFPARRAESLSRGERTQAPAA